MANYTAIISTTKGNINKTVTANNVKAAIQVARAALTTGEKLVKVEVPESLRRPRGVNNTKAKMPKMPKQTRKSVSVATPKTESVLQSTFKKIDYKVTQPDDGKKWTVEAFESKNEAEVIEFYRKNKKNCISVPYHGTGCYRVTYWQEIVEK